MFALHPRRVSLRVFAAAVALAACSGGDAPSPASPLPTSRTGDLLDAVGQSVSGITLDTSTTVIVVDPFATATYQIAGGHRLWIKDGGICDLTSTYGVGFWDDACIPATLPVTITATSWTDALGRPHVDFWPNLRFVPLDSKRASAELYLKAKDAVTDSTASILYCDNGRCVDESLVDASLATMRDRQQGFLYRRIKHFSGYQVSTGREGVEPDSTSTPP